MITFQIDTHEHTGFLPITQTLQQLAQKNGWKEGILTVYIPHTTAAVTIQENADPDVVTDMIYALEKAVPWRDLAYRHAEGNTAAHVKAAMLGTSAQVIMEGGRLALGTWQGVYFCEFDGPRHRTVWVHFAAS